MTWGEVIRELKAAGYVEVRSGKGSHRMFRHAATGKELWIAVHTRKDAGQLGNRILIYYCWNSRSHYGFHDWVLGEAQPQRGRNSMTTYYPIVVETETSGAVSAYIPGLPVFAAADTRAKVEQAIRETLTSYLEAHPTSAPTSEVRVARVSGGPGSKVRIVGPGALLGTGRSRRKARASRMNGRLGGRPRKTE